MLEYMLDTDICIYAMKHKPVALVDRFERSKGHMCVSSIILGELYYGAEKSQRRTHNMGALEQFLTRLDVLHFSIEAAAHYGDLRADLERAGTPCGSNDMLIGAHARSEGLTLVTNNRRKFDRMPGLRVENWV